VTTRDSAHPDPDHTTRGCSDPDRDPSAYNEPDPVHQATSVWMTAQQDARGQRRGRYTPGTSAHPAKMLPDIARHAIVHYTRPGDLVLDPMCGIGTTLVEAVHTGRHAVGIEYEPRWARIARANLALAAGQGATGRAVVHTADARTLPDLLRRPHALPLDPHAPPLDEAPPTSGDADRWDQARPVALIVTSPPYGQHVHGQVTPRPGHGVAKRDHRYAPTRRGSANLAHAELDALLAGFTDILTRAVTLLRPGGHVVITTRPFRRHGELIDLPTAVLHAAQDSGLTPIERCVAPLAGLREDRLVPRASFFQLLAVRNARAAGIPQHVHLHEDVLVLIRRPSWSSRVRNLVPDPRPAGSQEVATAALGSVPVAA
jgi:SAM-dependent methyltransferase